MELQQLETDRQKQRATERDRQTDTETDRQIDRQAGRQTDREREDTLTWSLTPATLSFTYAVTLFVFKDG